MDETYLHDFYRWYGKKKRTWKEWFGQPLQLKFMYYFRKCQKRGGVLYPYYRMRLKQLAEITAIDMPPCVKVGRGFYIMHLGGIVINGSCEIGEYVNINSGAVIGAEVRGKRCGIPKVGSYVYIGKNAAIVGKVTIGDDVLIAPNAYVNFDVPSHSIVIGNPGRIIPRENATEGYIYNVLK